MKGLVLRNLRRWYSRPILDAGGLLSVGYAYPNLIMADAYNSPGSPYWALKTYLILALKDDHPFWQEEEAPLPSLCANPEQKSGLYSEKRQFCCFSNKVPGFIISSSDTDAQLLTGGRYPSFDMNHAAQKYGKFAYSARFGFCVSHSGYTLEKIGCDSALFLSEGDGYWRERREVTDLETGENWVRSRWRPWADVSVSTALARLGDWHVRVHWIESGRSLAAVEGGFSVPRFNDTGEALPARNAVAEHAGDTAAESRQPEAAIVFPWAASRIVALESGFPQTLQIAARRKASLVIPAPNLNVIHPAVVIPVLEGNLEAGTTVWACAVWVGDGSEAPENDGKRGGDFPRITARGEKGGGYNFSISDRDTAIEISI
jgi:hypothetical protein